MKRWSDVELLVADVNVFVRFRCLLKLAVSKRPVQCLCTRRFEYPSLPETTDSHLFVPNIRPKTLTPVLVQDEIVFVIQDRAEAIIE